MKKSEIFESMVITVFVVGMFIIVMGFVGFLSEGDQQYYAHIYEPDGQLLVEGEVSSWTKPKDGNNIVTVEISGTEYRVPSNLVIISTED